MVYGGVKTAFKSIEPEKQKLSVNFVSGCAAGAISALITLPLDVIKVRLQLQEVTVGVTPKYSGIRGSLQTILKREGLRGWYRGGSMTFLGLVPNWAIYFASYNHMKEILRGVVPQEDLYHMLSAMSAGVITTLATNPLWVVKVRLQGSATREYTGPFNALARIAREEGMRGMMKGLVPSLTGVSHVMIQFPLYERCKEYTAAYRKIEVEKISALDVVLCSSASKLVAGSICYPHEVIRTRMQAERVPDGKYRTVISSLKVVYREEGWRAFYNGMGANLCRSVPTCAITFVSYEFISQWLLDELKTS